MEENNQPHYQALPENRLTPFNTGFNMLVVTVLQRHTQNTDGYASSSNGPTTHATI
jgi:hypothetical protein